MRKGFYLTLACCGLLLHGYALPVDSLVYFSDLDFTGSAEEYNFRYYGRPGNRVDVIDLLLMPYADGPGYSSKRTHEQINNCVEVLQKETEGLSNSKRVKAIYKYVHQRFLKVYKQENSFSDIFEKGEYNCVSASSLYAIIFRQLGIPFQIIEEPGHVYLVAYPQSERLFIETTSPEHGYIKVSDNDVEKFTRHLYQSKMISREEYEKSGSKELFDKYYYASSGLDLDKMPGVQYFNYAVYHLNNKEYEKASREIKKAYFLEPSERNKYLLKSILLYQTGNNEYSSHKQVQELVMLCRFNNLSDKEISNELVEQHFGKVMNDQLIKKSDYAGFDTSFVKIHSGLKDTSLKNEIAFDYHYELARLGLVNLKSRDYEMKHLAEAYRVNPKHANLQNIILAYFSKLVEDSNDPSGILRTMGQFDAGFGFLAQNTQYISIKCNCLLELAYQRLVLKDIKKGEAYLHDFEKLCDGNKELKPNERFVEKAYSEAASVYYKKGDRAKTRQLLTTGIKYAPDSFGLQVRLSQLH